jgi:hypothetical protein
LILFERQALRVQVAKAKMALRRTTSATHVDPVMEMAVRDWVEALLERKLDNEKSFYDLFKTGVLLCEYYISPTHLHREHTSSAVFILDLYFFLRFHLPRLLTPQDCECASSRHHHR